MCLDERKPRSLCCGFRATPKEINLEEEGSDNECRLRSVFQWLIGSFIEITCWIDLIDLDNPSSC